MVKRYKLIKYDIIGDGWCFYHTISKGLQNLFKINLFDANFLVKLCYEYISNNNEDWIDNYFKYVNLNKNKYLNNLIHDLNNNSNHKKWGDPYLEGKILCKLLNIQILLIEKLNKNVLHTNNDVYLFTLLNFNSNIQYEKYESFLKNHSEDKNIIYCYNANNYHFEFVKIV